MPIIYPKHTHLLAKIERYQSEWRHIQPELDGHDLVELGIPRGPQYAELLRSLRAARLDGKLHTRADELSFVASFVQRQ